MVAFSILIILALPIFTFFFEHFLQGTMDLMYRMVFLLNHISYIYLLF